MTRSLPKISFFLIAAFIIFSSSNEDTDSTGAPAASTGAPGERNCTTSGCHDDSQLNAGPGNPLLSLTGNPQGYVPGKTYTLTASLEQQEISRFGFEMVVLRDSDNQKAGDIIITDKSRTQLMPDFGEFKDRQYVTYTYEGTDPYSAGMGKWTFDWKAPETDVGPVTFYTAFLAGNNDGTDTGDLVYTKKLNLKSTSTIGIVEQNESISVEIYPNPVENRWLSVKFIDMNLTSVPVTLYSIDGKQLMDSVIATEGHLQLDVSDYAPGVYLMVINVNDRIISKKVIIQ